VRVKLRDLVEINSLPIPSHPSTCQKMSFFALQMMSFCVHDGGVESRTVAAKAFKKRPMFPHGSQPVWLLLCDHGEVEHLFSDDCGGSEFGNAYDGFYTFIRISVFIDNGTL